jgi:hypothetical protein
MRIFLMSILVTFGSFGVLHCAPVEEDASVWLIQEEFIKFGKKEVYEAQQQNWLQGFKKTLSSGGFWRSKSGFWPIYGMQAIDEPQYIYLIPLKNTAALDDFLVKKSAYNEGMSQEDKNQRQMLLSCMNFTISSLHQYVKSCSSGPDDAASWQKNPFVHYWVFGITPGNDHNFETQIQKVVAGVNAKGVVLALRVWRVLLGSDTPKYVIVLQTASQEALDLQVKSLEFVDGTIKDIVRNQREGSALMKDALSMMP